MTHTELRNALLVALSQRRDLCCVVPQNVGVVRYHGGRVARFGVRGQADISGILADGRRLEIEVKTGGARQSRDQKNWQDMITRYNGVYLVARDVPSTVAAIEAATT